MQSKHECALYKYIKVLKSPTFSSFFLTMNDLANQIVCHKDVIGQR
jgi:hypothetical protein